MAILTKLSPILRGSKGFLPVVTQNTKIRCVRFSTNKDQSGLTKTEEKYDVSTDVRPLGEKIKEGTKTVSYTGVILVGVGVTGIIFYYVFRELFSSNSSNSVYSNAFEKCKNDPRVADALGAPIKGYGEETTRRRRTHVSHAVYEKDGIQHMRMRFYIKGSRNKGVVELDMKKSTYGKYECRYLIVQLDDYSGKTFIIEDNRAALDKKDDILALPTLTLTE